MNFLRLVFSKLKSKKPLWVWLLFICVVIFVTIYFFLFRPINIVFDYSKSNYCFNRPIFFASIYKENNPEKVFEVEFDEVAVFTNKICVSPEKIIVKNNYKIQISPFGIPLFRYTININISEQPSVKNSLPEIIALSKPFTFSLDKKDALYFYILKIDESSIICSKDVKIISCDISNSKLVQGSSYDYKVKRIFNKNEVDEVYSGKLTLLPPVEISDSTIKDGFVVYSSPKTFTFTANKELSSADIVLEKVTGGQKTNVPINKSVLENKINVSIDEPLDRKANYIFTINKATAIDDSNLSDKKVINFSTSGGPEVSNINIGSSGVGSNAKIIITLSQSLLQNQDITKFVTLSGGAASITNSTNQIFIQLGGLTACSAFSINVKGGLTSENYITNNDAWSYNSRISCGYSQNIGYSVQGRPITAYFFGSGNSTVLFTGGIHGSEPSGAYIMDDFVSYLDSYGYQIPADKRIVIVPRLNPDGIASGSRYNANNVNLDRNFPSANWTADIDTSSGIIVNGGGTTPLSEPESQAIANLLSSLKPRLAVSFHASGSLVGANQYGDSTDIALMYAASIGYRSMIGIAEETMGYSITGEFEDWAGEAHGTPAILIELPNSSGRFFQSNLSTLLKIIKV